MANAFNLVTDGDFSLTTNNTAASTTRLFAYEYDSKGRAAFVKDALDGNTIRTGYDQTDRPNETEQRDGEGNLKYRTLIEYDKKNRVKAFNEATSDQNFKTEYTYDADNRVTKVRYNSSDTSKVDYVYDKLRHQKCSRHPRSAEGPAGRDDPEHAGDGAGGAGRDAGRSGSGIPRQPKRLQAKDAAVEHGRDTDTGAAGSKQRL